MPIQQKLHSQMLLKAILPAGLDLNRVLVNAMHSGQPDYSWDFNKIDILITRFKFKVKIPEEHRPTRKHCIYQNSDKINCT